MATIYAMLSLKNKGVHLEKTGYPPLPPWKFGEFHVLNGNNPYFEPEEQG